jgi:hypothetical protein
VLAVLAVLRLLQLMQLMQLIDDDRFMHSPESTSGYWIRPTLYPTLPYPTLPYPPYAGVGNDAAHRRRPQRGDREGGIP